MQVHHIIIIIIIIIAGESVSEAGVAHTDPISDRSGERNATAPSANQSPHLGAWRCDRISATRAATLTCWTTLNPNSWHLDARRSPRLANRHLLHMCV